MGTVTMKCTFQVGDRVVCVDGRIPTNVRGPVVVEGHVYTVSQIIVGLPPTRGSHYRDAWPAIALQEVPRPGGDAWDARRFRPVKPLSFWLGETQEITREIERAA